MRATVRQLFVVLVMLTVTTPSQAQVWPDWMPLPLQFEDRDELEAFLQEKLAEADVIDDGHDTIRIIELGEQMLSFDEPVPGVLTEACSIEEYDLHGSTESIGWGADFETGATIPVFCERPLGYETLEESYGDGSRSGMPWYTDEWNWQDGLVHRTIVTTKSIVRSPTGQQDTQLCGGGGYCVDVDMSEYNQQLQTLLAYWVGDLLIVYPNPAFWYEAGGDAWDDAYLQTTRSYSNKYNVDYVKIRLNDKMILSGDCEDFFLPWQPMWPYKALDGLIDDYRLGLLETYGGTAARNSPILQAAARDIGQACESNEITEKYLFHRDGPYAPVDGWCSEFATWAISEGSSLDPPTAKDVAPGGNGSLVVEDMWDFFYAEDLYAVDAEFVWSYPDSPIQPGDFVTSGHWGHSMLFVGWDGGFDPDSDTNDAWVIEGSMGSGLRESVQLRTSSSVRVCGPDVSDEDWENSDICQVALCKPGFQPGANPSDPPNPGGEECDFFGITHGGQWPPQ